jgi:hypothetical protein
LQCGSVGPPVSCHTSMPSAYCRWQHALHLQDILFCPLLQQSEIPSMNATPT